MSAWTFPSQSAGRLLRWLVLVSLVSSGCNTLADTDNVGLEPESKTQLDAGGDTGRADATADTADGSSDVTPDLGFDGGDCVDNDDDGYFSLGGCSDDPADCNDAIAQVAPGNAEVCNGLDNDCDGKIDEGTTNSCGGCVQLPASPGESCGGLCGDGVWECGADDGNSLLCLGEGLNSCGGCEELGDAPGDPCGVCGEYVCNGEGGLSCAELPSNACGGCQPLEQDPGAGCGQCGTVVCSGVDETSCQNPQRNECGGCGELAGVVGEPCGTCGSLACGGNGTSLICSGDEPNVCGGCNLLEIEPGQPCGECGVQVCAGATAVSCAQPVDCSVVGYTTLFVLSASNNSTPRTPGPDIDAVQLNKPGGDDVRFFAVRVVDSSIPIANNEHVQPGDALGAPNTASLECEDGFVSLNVSSMGGWVAVQLGLGPADSPVAIEQGDILRVHEVNDAMDCSEPVDEVTLAVGRPGDSVSDAYVIGTVGASAAITVPLLP